MLFLASGGLCQSANRQDQFDKSHWRLPVKPRVPKGQGLIYGTRNSCGIRVSRAVIYIGKARIFGCAFERAAFLARLPEDNVLDLPGEFEILVRDALGRMSPQGNLDRGIGNQEIRMMPSRL